MKCSVAKSTCLATTFLMLGLIFIPTTASAQNSLSLHLDENHALLDSSKQKRGSAKSLSRNRRPLASELALDSADEIIEPGGDRAFFQTHKALVYLKYFGGLDDFEDEDISETERTTKRILLYHGFSSISDYIKQSALKERFERMLNRFKKYKRMTTFTVHGSTEDLNFQHGRESDEPILKFKLGVSTRRGVEPRLSLLDTVTFRHDIFGQRTIVEYRLDF